LTELHFDMELRKTTTKQDVEGILAKLDKLTETLAGNGVSLSQLVTDVKELRESQKFLSEQYDDMKKQLQSSQKEVKALRSENQDLHKRVQHLEQSASQAHEAVNNLEQYGRRECLEFQGLAWSQNENTDDLVIQVSKMLKVDLNKKDISISHRLSECSDTNPRPTIIARFCSRRARDMLYSQRHRLKQHNIAHPRERVFINESHTKINRQRFNVCLKYKKANRFKFIWTKNGTIFLRRDVNEPTIAIKSDKDLVRYKIST